MINYKRYKMTVKELIRYGAEGLVIIWAVSFIFYRSYWLLLWTSPCTFIYLRFRASLLNEKRREQLAFQFRDMITAMYSSLAAGNTVEQSILHTIDDLKILYSEHDYIMIELYYISNRMNINITVEKCLEDFARRSGDDNIRSFADVLAIAKRSGGNLPQIIQTAVESIRVKIEVQQEIETLVTGRRNEFMIMACIPLLIILYLNLFSDGLIAVLYTTTAGRIVMTCCLAGYISALIWGQRILRIII